MYEQHFGFSRPLFFHTLPQDEAVFRTTAAKSLTRDLAIALARKDSTAIVSGPNGIGKTTLALDALKAVSTRLAFACISQPPLTGGELLEQLLTEFGFEPARESRVERLQLWRQFLSEMAATDTRVCLLVENAENFDPEVLQSLHGLTAADAALSPGANIVLTTTLPPEDLLTQAPLAGCNQRVRLRRRIEPLSESETRDYLEFKCRFGGCDVDAVLADDADEAIFAFSAGVLRMIDSIFESALIAAAIADRPRVDGELIRALAESHYGVAPKEPAGVVALLEAPAATDSIATVARPATGPDAIPTLTEYVESSGRDETEEQLGHLLFA